VVVDPHFGPVAYPTARRDDLNIDTAARMQEQTQLITDPIN